MELFAKLDNEFYPLSIFVKKLHRRCSTGSKYNSEYNNKFFPDLSKVKLMTFLNLFSKINCSYYYLPEAYVETSRTSTMEHVRWSKYAPAYLL